MNSNLVNYYTKIKKTDVNFNGFSGSLLRSRRSDSLDLITLNQIVLARFSQVNKK